MNKHFNTNIIFFIIFFIIFLDFPVSAYVLKGPHLLEMMTQKMGKAKKLLVFQELRFYGGTQKESPVIIKETLRYHCPDKFRSDAISSNRKRIHVLSADKALTIIDGKVTAEIEDTFDHYKDIFLFRSRILLTNRLSLSGVDVSTSSLGRFQDKTAYVIGAQYPDESKPQVWIDKKTFIPLRWIIECDKKEPDKSLEVRYLKWQMFGKVIYPMHMEFYQNGVLVRELNVEKIVINPPLEDKLFNIDEIKSAFISVEHDIINRSDELTDVQKTIEEFNKIYK